MSKDTTDKDVAAGDAQRDAAATQDAQQSANDAGGTPVPFDEWLKAQPEDAQKRISENVSGLKSALAAEREASREREKELRKLADAAEKGSEAQKKLEALADQLAESDRRADFYEAAQREGVTNMRLAYTVAVQDELFDRRGNPQFDEMRTAYPELFVAQQAAPAGHAGAGTQKPPATKVSMNDFIRRAAGRA